MLTVQKRILHQAGCCGAALFWLIYFFMKQKYKIWSTQIWLLCILHSKFCQWAFWLFSMTRYPICQFQMGTHVEHCTAYFGMKSLSSWQFSPWLVSYLCEILTCCSFDIQYSFSVESCLFSFSPLPASLRLCFHEEMMLLKDFKLQIIISFFLKEIWGNKH